MLANAPPGQEWYEAEFELPAELFKFDFVIMDQQTGGVDNNRARVSAQGLCCSPCSLQDAMPRLMRCTALSFRRQLLGLMLMHLAGTALSAVCC